MTSQKDEADRSSGSTRRSFLQQLQQGAMAGGLLIGIVEQFAGRYLPTGFADTSAYALLLLMLLVRPEGLFATIQRKKV